MIDYEYGLYKIAEASNSVFEFITNSELACMAIGIPVPTIDYLTSLYNIYG